MPSIRTALVTAVAVVGIACSVAPVANATKNDHRFAQTQAQKEFSCDGYYDIFKGDVDSAGAADQAGNVKARTEHLKNATQDLNMARGAGCDWAT
jgi:hypothetical protein